MGFTRPGRAAAALLTLALAAAPGGAGAQQASFENPPNLTPGSSQVRFTSRPTSIQIGGGTYTRNVYNGLYTPPTLRLQPGQAFNLLLVDSMQANAVTPATGLWTNLHYHGFNVSPAPTTSPYGDQVIWPHINQYQQAAYSFTLPSWHPQGLFWYHPHPHGVSDQQVKGGMAGAIVIGDLLGNFFPAYAALNPAERIILLKDFETDPVGGSSRTVYTVNGDSVPALAMTGPEFWRIANTSADAYYQLSLVDASGQSQPLVVVARDGNRVAVPYPVHTLLLPPAARVEAMANVPAGTGYSLTTAAVQGTPAQTLLTASRTGTYAPLPAVGANVQLADSILKFAAQKVDTTRSFTFKTDTTPTLAFLINGDTFEISTLNTRVPLGHVEDWVITNDTTQFNEMHVFHIHQGDFLVLDDGTGTPDLNGFRDVVNLPAGKTVRIRMAFKDPEQVGVFVYHCHILFHEDNGMMQSICVDDGKPGTCNLPSGQGAHGRHVPPRAPAGGGN